MLDHGKCSCLVHEEVASDDFKRQTTETVREGMGLNDRIPREHG